MMGRQARLLGTGEAGSASGATLALTPHGRVRFERSVGVESEIDAPTVERIRDAFARGHGHGLFHLGAVEATSALPPVFAFWRDFGRVFMTALCAVPDLDERRDWLPLSIPRDSLRALVETAPPMIGGEYLSLEVLEGLWADMEVACRSELAAFDGSFQEFLRTRNPVWNQVGRVHFHLAEQKRNQATPFAFLATYTTRLGKQNKVQHQPLGKALQQFAGARNKRALLALLRPVHNACERSPFLREIVDSGSVFHPLGWTPAKGKDVYQTKNLCFGLEGAWLLASSGARRTSYMCATASLVWAGEARCR